MVDWEGEKWKVPRKWDIMGAVLKLFQSYGLRRSHRWNDAFECILKNLQEKGKVNSNILPRSVQVYP